MRKAKKIGAILLSVLIWAVMLPETIFAAGVDGAKAEIATWEGWRQAAVTFTFDDGAPSDYEYIAPAFDQYGYKATFYLVTGWNPDWTEFQKLADNGHEIGSHSDSHGENMSGEEASSKANIEAKIKSKNGCLTVAYPNCNVPNVSAVKANYIAGRIGNGSWQFLPDIMSKDGPSDWAYLPALMTGSETGITTSAHFTNQIQKAIDQGGWVAFLTHGLEGKNNGAATYSPTSLTALEETLSWANQMDDIIWVTSVCNAAMYVKERNAASLTLKTNNSNGLTYTLTHNIADTICDYQYPLSVRVPISSQWNSAEVKQAGQHVDSEVKDGMVYFSAIPNGGDIVITSACDGKHNFAGQAYQADDEGKHYQICSVCGAQSVHEAHTGGTATCKQKAKCSLCKAEYGEFGPHTLDPVIVKASFTRNGKIQTFCLDCNQSVGTETIYAIKTCKLNETTLTYNGKEQKPSVIVLDSNDKVIDDTYYTVTYSSGRKNVGTYTANITFKGAYSGTKKIAYKINPPKISLSSVKAGKKSIKVKWAKKTKQVTGYEIQYSLRSDFKSSNKTLNVKSAKTTSKNISKLKAGKKYYVRVRTYKTVKGKKYYSEWSESKKVKTK